MAKEFAKSFYNSKRWKSCRDSYIKERIMIDGAMCEKCGNKVGMELHHKIALHPQNINDPNITLNHENLMYLCKDCHFEITKAAIAKKIKIKANRKILTNGMYFENGVPQKQKVKIIYGPPAAGKTTYVTKHMEVGDMVVDLDYIRYGISYRLKDKDTSNLLSCAISIRDHIYQLIEDKAVDCKTIWIIAGLPSKAEREKLKQRFNAELIALVPTREECIERALCDGRKKIESEIMIDKWFENFS